MLKKIFHIVKIFNYPYYWSLYTWGRVKTLRHMNQTIKKIHEVYNQGLVALIRVFTTACRFYCDLYSVHYS